MAIENRIYFIGLPSPSSVSQWTQVNSVFRCNWYAHGVLFRCNSSVCRTTSVTHNDNGGGTRSRSCCANVLHRLKISSHSADKTLIIVTRPPWCVCFRVYTKCKNPPHPIAALYPHKFAIVCAAALALFPIANAIWFLFNSDKKNARYYFIWVGK
jgi:hypothetical protein